MPRPKKYHTADERREAKAASMRRSHHARREEVNERRRELYAARTRRQKKAQRRLERVPKLDGQAKEELDLFSASPSMAKRTGSQLEETRRVETIRSHLARVRSVRTAVSQTLQGSAKAYLDGRCRWFETDCSDMDCRASIEVIESHLNKWNGFYERLKPSMDDIYELAGYGDEYKTAETLSREIGQMVQWLEDILCVALVDPSEVGVAHRKGELLYQYETRDSREMEASQQ